MGWRWPWIALRQSSFHMTNWWSPSKEANCELAKTLLINAVLSLCANHTALYCCSYVLTLIVDSMRAVRSFHLDKAAASVLTTCVCCVYLPLSLLHDISVCIIFLCLCRCAYARRTISFLVLVWVIRFCCGIRRRLRRASSKSQNRRKTRQASFIHLISVYMVLS